MRGVFFRLHLVSGRAEWAMAFSPREIKVVRRTAQGFRDDHRFFLEIRAAFPGNFG